MWLCIPISGLVRTRSGFGGEAFAIPEGVAVGGFAGGRDCGCAGFQLRFEARWGARRLRLRERRGKHAEAHSVGRRPVLRG